MTSKMFNESASAQEVADGIVQKASVALAEKGKHGLGSNSTVQGLPTTEAITDKILKEGARKLAHDKSEFASEAQVRILRDRADPCDHCSSMFHSALLR